MAVRTVPIDFVRSAVATAERLGVDIGLLLGRAGVAPELLEQDRARVTVDQVAATMRQLWRITGDELFGLGPAPVPRGAIRLVGFGLVACPDLGSAIERFGEYQRLLPGFPPMAVTTEGGRTRCTLDTSVLAAGEELLTVFLLAALHRIVSWGIGRRVALRQAEFPYPRPRNVADYDLVFGAPLVFDAAIAAITFDSELLRAPLTRSEADLIDWTRNAPIDVLSRRDYGTSLAEQVRKILTRGLSGGATAERWPTADEVAKRLSMSPQTVRRKLGEEGTSITQIREDILRDAAVASLVRGDETVESLSARLGFSEPSAFRRAFRRWTGSPPGSYRGASPV
ncbi:AraC family transcriptional regulator [Nocardia tenerifensis]|uniref:AraC family transcriptional regulator n=1 Tax=Nocardia tenerifensis TaxID=228006 RepID=A0A318K5A4_9NOCA|nr:AraC family transcriptional regulator [Nocardia tenerifensis]PXX66819.1 AraC family transcriptional regulator [Nocardia tenerifensis]